MKIKVSVPATSANVGSGFDALGLAVTLYNTVTFEESDKLDISAADGTRIPRNESNLVYRSAKGLFDKVGKKIPPLKIVQTNPIPMYRATSCSSSENRLSMRLISLLLSLSVNSFAYFSYFFSVFRSMLYVLNGIPVLSLKW